MLLWYWLSILPLLENANEINVTDMVIRTNGSYAVVLPSTPCAGQHGYITF